LQAEGIGSPAVNETRDNFREHFESKPEPYTPEFAQQLGATLTKFMAVTNEIAIKSELTDIEVGMIWNRPGPEA
jgi:hypothetical protein